MTMPPGWGQFDVDALPEIRADCRKRRRWIDPPCSKSPPHRLYDGTVIQVGKSSEAREELLSRFRTIVMLVTGAVILVGLAGGLVFTRSTLQPVTALASVVRDIVATGRTDSRVPVRERRRARRAERSFNAMLDRIGALITGMRERSTTWRTTCGHRWRAGGAPPSARLRQATPARSGKRSPTVSRNRIGFSRCSIR